MRQVMVDLKKRAERRKTFYEKVRSDPVQFLQVHGFQTKIHIDHNISMVAENCLMPYRGDFNNMIDRFDARAHLDQIDLCVPKSGKQKDGSSTDGHSVESALNYERWRSLIQNDYLNISEEKHLNRILMKEKYGQPTAEGNRNKRLELSKPKASAAIGYNYDDPGSSRVTQDKQSDNEDSENSSEDEEDLTELDTQIDVQTISSEDILRINGISHKFGLSKDDFTRFLDEDRKEAERMKVIKAAEAERSMYSGRKSRKERRALRDKRKSCPNSSMIQIRTSNFGELHNSSNNSLDQADYESSESESDEGNHEATTEFITSFGGDADSEDDCIKSKPSSNQVFKKSDKKKKSLRKPSSDMIFGPSLPTATDEDDKKSTETFHHKSSFGQTRNSYRRNRSRSKSRDRRRDSRSPGNRNRRSHGRRRSRSRDRDKRRRSRSNDRRRRSRSGDRNRCHNRDRKQSRSRSNSSVDSFGRSRRKDSIKRPSPVTNTPTVFRLDEIQVPIASPQQPIVKTEDPPPPPVRRYYRHDLVDKNSDDEDPK